MSALNYCMQISPNLLSSDGYADGYQLKISLATLTKDNFSDFELPCDIMAQCPNCLKTDYRQRLSLIPTYIYAN